MMSFRRTGTAAAMAACFLLCVMMAACTPKEDSTSQTHSHDSDGGSAAGSPHDQHGDSMAGSDTDRAAADLEAQERERKNRPRRPALHDSRRGSRVVDQPRPTAPPPR